MNKRKTCKLFSRAFGTWQASSMQTQHYRAGLFSVVPSGQKTQSALRVPLETMRANPADSITSGAAYVRRPHFLKNHAKIVNITLIKMQVTMGKWKLKLPLL